MKIRHLLLLLFWTVFIATVPLSLLAQSLKNITGTVYDSSANNVIPGVSIIVKGSSRGASTDENGKYSIQAAPSDVLVFSIIGYADQQVTVGSRSAINVVMQENAMMLQSVVVNVGYGTQRRADVTGAVASISSKEISELPLTNFQQALQGRTPGIDVVAAGATPGSGVTVRI
ncbi:MAG: carboxypeptidase-like regulatory domain-containing protein, partial [Chitinophagaceae bacterium]|nr:carboxypeptidase-like regulatory domain-containing protein [Chitinophagaceae bacterium]